MQVGEAAGVEKSCPFGVMSRSGRWPEWDRRLKRSMIGIDIARDASQRAMPSVSQKPFVFGAARKGRCAESRHRAVAAIDRGPLT